jgi:hypothetical protein
MIIHALAIKSIPILGLILDIVQSMITIGQSAVNVKNTNALVIHINIILFKEVEKNNL